jgi:hypothetical protein
MFESAWDMWRLLTLETRMESCRRNPGKPTTRRYSPEEKAATVRMVRTLRAELGTEHGTVQRVARQLGYLIESVWLVWPSSRRTTSCGTSWLISRVAVVICTFPKICCSEAFSSVGHVGHVEVCGCGQGGCEGMRHGAPAHTAAGALATCGFHSVASLAIRGTLALFRAASGPVQPVDPQRLNAAGSVYLARPSRPDFIRSRDEFAWRTPALFESIAAGTLTATSVIA